MLGWQNNPFISPKNEEGLARCGLPSAIKFGMPLDSTWVSATPPLGSGATPNPPAAFPVRSALSTQHLGMKWGIFGNSLASTSGPAESC